MAADSVRFRLRLGMPDPSRRWRRRSVRSWDRGAPRSRWSRLQRSRRIGVVGYIAPHRNPGLPSANEPSSEGLSASEAGRVEAVIDVSARAHNRVWQLRADGSGPWHGTGRFRAGLRPGAPADCCGPRRPARLRDGACTPRALFTGMYRSVASCGRPGSWSVRGTDVLVCEVKREFRRCGFRLPGRLCTKTNES